MPVIRGHAGELAALAWLPDTVKQRVMPLVEVVPGRVQQTARTLAGTWGDARPLLLDTAHLLAHDSTDPRRHQLIELFERCRGALWAIPVGGLGRGIDHTVALAGVAAAQRRGAALRVAPTDLWPGERRRRELDGWLEVVDLEPHDVDLVIDLGELREPNHVATVLAAHEALADLPYAKEWRSVTLAAAGSPGTLPSGRDHEDIYDRLDWRLWKMVTGGDLPRTPGFGDHVTDRPSSVGREWAASIAYTTGQSWVVVKRRRLAPSSDELRAASQALLARPEFAGGRHCRGCATIEEFAVGGGSGGLDGWRAAGVCHHIATSVGELTSLVG